MTRIGFVGCGRHATRMLYPSLSLLDVELVAVASLVPDEAQATARRFGAARWYVGHRALLDEEALDAVLVALPPPSYAEVIGDVLDRGLPCWAEKPAAASAAEAEELAVRASEAGIPLCVGFMKRFAPAYTLARAAVEEPSFGAPAFFEGRFSMGPGLYRDDYTFLVDNSIHMVDLARWFMGEVEDVTVERATGPDGRVAYAVLLRFVSGAVGTLHLSTMRSWQVDNERVEITGAGPAVIVENLVRVVGRPAQGGPGTLWEPNLPVPTDANRLLSLAGYVPELEHFLAVVRGEAEPRATIADAAAALRLVDRIYDAADVGPRPERAGAAW
ncbi:MAG TPA: Gfo/Idh/MocA family oxidoreductase [Actinobacteria bacterium]|nr:Gfo/Idh/MocA family oxidoreductase [Actinomycetota bacterium]